MLSKGRRVNNRSSTNMLSYFQISEVERIQNLSMYQSFVVKRQTILYRDTNGDISPDVQKTAQQRVERCWLWHGTNAEVMDKILQQGFNRSFCGKNATFYGKGVYFARDASYSSCYATPDDMGFKYVLACRVVVGEYAVGKKDALIPDIRDASTNTLYDSTVGLLANDTMVNPSIYVTYHDAQAYPEVSFLKRARRALVRLQTHTHTKALTDFLFCRFIVFDQVPS